MRGNSNDRYVLLNPGPVTLTDTVRQAMLGRDMCHREAAFSDLMAEVRGRLQSVYDTGGQQWTVVMITGSGTAAVESMVASLVQGPERALVCANGVYGERMATMLRRAGKPAVVVQSEWDQAIDFELVERELKRRQSIQHVVAVHHETTTGRLNDLNRLADLCTRFGKRMLIDTVSSFGGEQIDFANWPVDAVAATANKCLHGVTGTAFVLCQRELLLNGQAGAASLYLDLATNFSAQEAGYPAFTPAVVSMYALKQALVELEAEGGWRRRHQIYETRSRQITVGLAELGIKPLLPSPQVRSSVLTAYHLPRGRNYRAISEPLEQNKIIIYAGQKQLEEVIFRIAVMGDLRDDDFDRLLSIIRNVIAENR